jgi:hypothetical protein
MAEAWRRSRRRDATRHVTLAHVHIRLGLIHADTRDAVVIVTRDRNGMAVESRLNTVSAIGGGLIGGGCLESGAVCAVVGG